MAEYLRDVMAKAKLERQKAKQSKWTPGSWSTPLPDDTKCLRIVIIGGNSIFRTPKELRNFCQLRFLPPVAQAAETSYRMISEEEQASKEILDIAGVDPLNYWRLECYTEGKFVLVLFNVVKKYAWLPTSRKKED